MARRSTLIEEDGSDSFDARSQVTALPLLYEKSVSHDTKTELTTFCDPHDLLAVVGEASQDVQVFRINGQLVFTIKRRSSEVDVTALQFKPDGSVLAVGHSDGVCTLHSGENGRLISQISALKHQMEDNWKLDLAANYEIGDDAPSINSSITRINWCMHSRPYDNPPFESQDGISSADDVTFTEWIKKVAAETGDVPSSGKEDIRGIKRLTDLITNLDVTRDFPRLSPIPAHGARHGSEGAKFTSHTSLESVFDIEKERTGDEYGAVDVLVIANGSGSTNVLLDDTVKIGETSLGYQPLKCSAHQHFASHVFLCEHNNHEAPFELDYLALPMETLGGSLLHVISANTKRMQVLLSYITQTIRCIAYDWSTGQQLPSRFIKNITEELSEKEEGDLVTNLFHLAMTSTFTPTIHEWLTDIIKETNLRRWDQAIGSMYTNIQDHIFCNLLPALDRLEIATTTLRGHARFHEGTTKFEVAPELFSSILEGIDAIRLVAQKVQLRIVTEHRQFVAFNKWLKVMIDVGAGMNTPSAVETEEREVPNLDYSLILAYITDTLMASKLEPHLSLTPTKLECSREEFFADPLISQMSFEKTTSALDALAANGLSQDIRSLVNISSIAVFLNGHARYAMESITRWQSKMVPTTPESYPLTYTSLEPTEIRCLDMKMHIPNRAPGIRSRSMVYVLMTDSSGSVGILSSHERLSTQNSSVAPVSTHEMFGQGRYPGRILDGKLLDEKQALLLVSGGAEDFALVLQNLEPDGQTEVPEFYRVHLFSGKSGFQPQRIMVGGRREMRVCVVVGRDGRRWQVLELERPGHGVIFGNFRSNDASMED